MRFFLRAAFLTILLAGQFAFAAAIDLTCAGGGACNDNITSLGIAVIRITDPAVIAALAGSPPAGYDPSSHLFITPLLFDQATLIGRSAPFAGGSASDTGGVTVGTGGSALTNVGDPSVFPSGFPSGNNDEIHTAILSLNLQGGGFAVKAGTAVTTGPNAGVNSIGEVESIGCNSIATSTPIAACPGGSDFPANSFFDVFTDLSTPFGDFHNNVPLVVQNSSITALPPTVIYVHGQSSSVGIFADAANGFGEIAGDHFGDMILTGHGAGFSPTGGSAGTAGGNSNNDAKAFGTQMNAIIAADSDLTSGEKSFLEAQVGADTGVPEPSTVTLVLIAGIAGLAGRKLRRRA